MTALDPPLPAAPLQRAAAASASSPSGTRRRPSRAWLVLGLLLGALALALLAARALMGLELHEPVRVYVDGEQVFSGSGLSHLSFGAVFAAVLGVGLALLLTLVLVPLAVAAALVAVAVVVVLVVVLGLGLPVLAVLLVAAVLLSPLILLGWLLVKLLN